MKNLTNLLLLILIIMISACTKDAKEDSSGEVPVAITDAFHAEHKDVKNAKWEKEGSYYEVEWKVNGLEKEIVYDSEGNIVASEQEIPVSSVPVAISDYVNQNYPGVSIEEAEEVTTSDGTFIEVEFHQGNKEIEILFDSNGNVLDTEEEEDEDDDDDD